LKNRLPERCYGLFDEGGFSCDVTGGSLCGNTQIIHVLRRGTPCVLGAFEPYEISHSPQLHPRRSVDILCRTANYFAEGQKRAVNRTAHLGE